METATIQTIRNLEIENIEIQSTHSETVLESECVIRSNRDQIARQYVSFLLLHDLIESCMKVKIKFLKMLLFRTITSNLGQIDLVTTHSSQTQFEHNAYHNQLEMLRLLAGKESKFEKKHEQN